MQKQEELKKKWDSVNFLAMKKRKSVIKRSASSNEVSLKSQQ